MQSDAIQKDKVIRDPLCGQSTVRPNQPCKQSIVRPINRAANQPCQRHERLQARAATITTGYKHERLQAQSRMQPVTPSDAPPCHDDGVQEHCARAPDPIVHRRHKTPAVGGHSASCHLNPSPLTIAQGSHKDG